MSRLRLHISFKSLFFSAVTLLTILVLLQVELPLLLGLNANWEAKIDDYRWLLHAHAAFAAVALFLCPLQFLSNPSVNYRAMHRLVGWIGSGSILVSAPLAIYISLAHLTGNDRWAMAIQGLLWMVVTAAAVWAAMRKRFHWHKKLMAHSYALTLTFVLSRFVVDVMGVDITPLFGGSAQFTAAATLLPMIAARFVYTRDSSASHYAGPTTNPGLGT